MSNVMGIDQLKRLLDLAFTSVNLVDAIKKNGSNVYADIGLVLAAIPGMVPAFQNMNQTVPELKDLSEDEAKELVAYIMAKLTLQDAHAMKVLAASLNVAVASVGLYQAIKNS